MDIRRLGKRILYLSGYYLFRLAVFLFWRRETIGAENVPLNGPVIIASNHISLADPPIIGCSVRRELHFAAKKELFEIPFFGWLITQVNAIRVNRGSTDFKAVREILTVLENGGGMIIFPEGTRHKPGKLGKPKQGVGFMARQSKASIVPTLIMGSDKIKRFKKIRIYFSKPITFENIQKAELSDKEITDRVMEEIEQMYKKYRLD
ncbi:MAG: lysophospholipid acyltransferase family protein [bacterium]